jgi:hypothetical protein
MSRCVFASGEGCQEKRQHVGNTSRPSLCLTYSEDEKLGSKGRGVPGPPDNQRARVVSNEAASPGSDV